MHVLSGAALKMTDRIYWGEICNHHQGGKPSDESRKRQDGYLAVNVVIWPKKSFGSYINGLVDCVIAFIPTCSFALQAAKVYKELAK